MDLPSITFMTPANTAAFWGMVGKLMFMIMPLLLIYAATTLGGETIRVIKNAFSFRKQQEDERYDIKIKDKS